MATTLRRASAAAVLLTALGASALAGAPTVAAAPVTAGSAAAAPAGVTTGTARITGSGFGHGVGMSQYGALGMARAGSTATQIVSHYFTGVTVAPVTDAVDLKVNVVHRGRGVVLRPLPAGTATGARLLLTPRTGAALSLGVGDQAGVTPSGGGLKIAVRRASGGTQTIQTSGLGVTWSGTRALAGAAARVAVSSTSLGGSGLKERSYRWGRVWLSNLSGGIEAVTTVDLHSGYLRGLAEMPSSWPAAALQAQAITARSFALVAARAAARPSCGGCQVWDDQRSQMYVGWAKEGERIGSTDYGARWAAAVSATSPTSSTGIAVLYQGAVVQTYYASSTGGRTRDPKTVWGTSVPYLRSVPDPWSLSTLVNPTFAAWTRSASVAGLAAMFGLSDLASVRVTAWDSSGAATQITATSAAGVVRTVTGETFRARLGLPSSWVGAIALPALPLQSAT